MRKIARELRRPLSVCLFEAADCAGEQSEDELVLARWLSSPPKNELRAAKDRRSERATQTH